MTKKKHGELKRWAAFLAIVAALFSLIMLGKSVAQRSGVLESTGLIGSGPSIDVGLLNAPASLDIRTEPGTAIEQALIGNVYETLIGRDQNNRLIPALADSWTTSQDGLTVTLHLRGNVTFSNGDTLDGEDVVWSLKQIISGTYVGHERLNAIAAVDSDRANRVTLTLRQPDATLLRALSGRAGIVYDRNANIDYATQALGSGPFTVGAYRKGSNITLKRNAHYWGARKAASNQVMLHYYPNESTLMNAAASNKVVMALPLEHTSLTDITKKTGLKAVQGSSTSKVMLVFNCGTESPMSDLRTRQSFRYLIDTAAIASSAMDAKQALGGPIGPLEPGYEDLTGVYPHDQAKAAQMLTYYSTRYFGDLTFLVPQEYQTLGEQLNEYLKQGTSTLTAINPDMQVVDDATLNQRLASGDFKLAIMTVSGTDNVDLFNGVNNTLQYQNGNAQEAYRNAATATTSDAYANGMKQFASMVSQDAAAAWLYERGINMAVSGRLHGYPVNMTDELLPLKDVTLEK